MATTAEKICRILSAVVFVTQINTNTKITQFNTI